MNYRSLATLLVAGIVVWKPVVGVEVSCLYDANSEFPWVESRVCQVEERPLLLNDEGTPVCSDARADKDGDGWGWENNQSCMIDPTLTKEVSDVPGLTVVQDDLVVLEMDFETAEIGTITPAALNKQWETPLWHMGITEGRAQIVQDAEKGKAMQVKFPANEFGSNGAVGFLNDLSFGVDFQRNFEELYVSYDVKFSEGFEFVQGGKLPGLCGYNITQEPRDGCNTGGGFPTGYDGWSARGMWREDGILENYMYHADQFYQYGDDEMWDVKAQPGQWHTIQHRVVLNTPGDANGLIEAWFDGVKVLSSNTMLYRKTADIYINLFYFSTFYGGADQSWAPSIDQYMYYDNFRIATTPLPELNVAEATQDVATAKATEAPQDVQASVTAAGTDNLQEEVVSIDTGSAPVGTTDVAIVNEAGDVADGNNTVAGDLAASAAEPEIAAAKDLDAGGGAFFGWGLGALVVLRRRHCRI